MFSFWIAKIFTEINKKFHRLSKQKAPSSRFQWLRGIMPVKKFGNNTKKPKNLKMGDFASSHQAGCIAPLCPLRVEKFYSVVNINRQCVGLRLIFRASRVAETLLKRFAKPLHEPFHKPLTADKLLIAGSFKKANRYRNPFGNGSGNPFLNHYRNGLPNGFKNGWPYPANIARCLDLAESWPRGWQRKFRSGWRIKYGLGRPSCVLEGRSISW